MNFGDPSTIGTEMADRFVASGANLPPPLFNIGLNKQMYVRSFEQHCKAKMILSLIITAVNVLILMGKQQEMLLVVCEHIKKL